MYALMIAMNISSNGATLSRESTVRLQRRYRFNSNDPVARLMYHQALWRLKNFHSYQYTLSRRCFAMPESRVRVQVESGMVTSVFPLPASTEASSLTHEAHSIDELFELAHRALMTDPEAVRVEYHPTHGYPLSIIIEARASMRDPAYQTA